MEMSFGGRQEKSPRKRQPQPPLPPQQKPPPVSKKPPPKVATKPKHKQSDLNRNASMRNGRPQVPANTPRLDILSATQKETLTDTSENFNNIDGPTIVDHKSIDVDVKEEVHRNNNHPTSLKEEEILSPCRTVKCSSSDIVRQAALKKKVDESNNSKSANIDTLEELKMLRSTNKNNSNKRIKKNHEQVPTTNQRQQSNNIEEVLRAMKAASKASKSFQDRIQSKSKMVVTTDLIGPSENFDSEYLHKKLVENTTNEGNKESQSVFQKYEEQSIIGTTLLSKQLKHSDTRILAENIPLTPVLNKSNLKKTMLEEDPVWLLITLILSFEAELPSRFFEVLSEEKKFKDLLSEDVMQKGIEMLAKMYR